MKKKMLSILFLNILLIVFFLYKRSVVTPYNTRVSIYTFKTIQNSDYKNDNANDIFNQINNFFKVRNDIHISKGCDFTIKKSVEFGTLFLDISCMHKNDYIEYFNTIFMSYLTEVTRRNGLKWDTAEQLKEYYYNNLLTENVFSQDQSIILPRYSFIFEDNINNISHIDLFLYFITSFLILNLLIYRLSKSAK